MKLTKSQIKKIIQEEIANLLDEQASEFTHAGKESTWAANPEHGSSTKFSYKSPEAQKRHKSWSDIMDRDVQITSTDAQIRGATDIKKQQGAAGTGSDIKDYTREAAKQRFNPTDKSHGLNPAQASAYTKRLQAAGFKADKSGTYHSPYRQTTITKRQRVGQPLTEKLKSDLSKEKHGDHMYSDYDPDPLVAMKMVLDELEQKFTNPKPGEGEFTLDAVAAWKSLNKVYSQMRGEKRAEQGILPKPLP